MTEARSEHPRPPFVPQQEFLETAFERRFQGLLRQAWLNRSWHVIAAVPGSGKSLGISDLILGSGAYKDTNGVTRLPILAIRAPKNAAREQALGLALSAAFGVIPSMPWALRRSWLVQILASCGVECIVIDDAQDLKLTHLALLKELTDNLAAPPYQRHIGLCLVAAHSGNVIPFKETFAGPDILWRQFRRRMDTEQPYCVVLGHTAAAGEQNDLYLALQPDPRSRWEWTGHHGPSHPSGDKRPSAGLPTGRKRCGRDHLRRGRRDDGAAP